MIPCVHDAVYSSLQSSNTLSACELKTLHLLARFGALRMLDVSSLMYH